jgi:transitional endoplasmic reticulum ATPase
LNAALALGDDVEVSKMSQSDTNILHVVDAKKVMFRSTQIIEQTEFLVNAFLHQTLVGRYISVGASISVTIYGKPYTFICSETDPKPVAAKPGQVFRIAPQTRVSWIKAKQDDSKVEINDTASYQSVGGLRDQIKLLKELIELPLTNPDLFRQYGIRPPRGVLLYGPPGTGKTLLASAVAASTGAKCFQLSASDVVSKFYGESESRLREMFEQARQHAPSIIFIDELDAIAPKRDASDSEVTKRVVGSLLALMDGIDSKPSAGGLGDRVVVLAATNRPNSLDPALRRPGRFDREIEIPIPNEKARKEILDVYIKKMPRSLFSRCSFRLCSNFFDCRLTC